MKPPREEWLQLLILAVPFCAVALFWDKLPPRIPIHWNIHGEIDNYASKPLGALAIPVTNVVLAIFLWLIPQRDEKLRSYDAETRASVARAFKIGRLVITLFTSCIALAIPAFALGFHFDMMRLTLGGMAIVIIVLGNFMGKLRPNYFMGIRTPWTLKSRTIWIKTHRLGGVVMIAGGICLLVLYFLLPASQYFLYGLLPVLVLIAIVPAAYSYYSYRAEKKTPEPVDSTKN